MDKFKGIEVRCPKCGEEDEFTLLDGETDIDCTWYDCDCDSCGANFTITLKSCEITLNKKVVK